MRLALRLVAVLLFATFFARRPAIAAPRVPVVAPVEETPADRASKLRSQGNDAMIGMRYSDALVLYEQAARETPDDATHQYNIGRAHQLLGDYPEALTAFEAFDNRAPPPTKARVGNMDAIFAQIRPRVAELALACSVPGARVLVRNRVVGVTPLAPTRLGAGAATVQVELDGFFTETRDVLLPGGGSLALEVALHRKSTDGLVEIRTTPLGASIFVDGKPSGTTTPGVELALPAGSHEIRATRDGYDDARVPLVLAPGATRDVDIPLARSMPLTSKWWFWTTIGVVVAGGVLGVVAATTERGADHGTLPPGRVGAP